MIFAQFKLAVILSLSSTIIAKQSDLIQKINFEKINNDVKFICEKRHPFASQAYLDRWNHFTNEISEIYKGSSPKSGMEVWIDSISDSAISQNPNVFRPATSPVVIETKMETTVVMASMNALVRFNANENIKNPKTVIICAHLDSTVSSYDAYNGIFIAVMMEIVRLFAGSVSDGSRLRDQNIIFLFGSGGNLGSLNAETVLQHSWIKPLVSNGQLEVISVAAGGVGGPPIVFRGTSSQLRNAYMKSASNPHINILSRPLYEMELINSQTSFQIFEKEGVKGIDYAFYQNRGYFNTRHDSYDNYNPSDSRVVASDLLALLENIDSSEEYWVYFDLFRNSVISYSAAVFHFLNFSLLILNPIALWFHNRKLLPTSKAKWQLFKSFGWLQLIQILTMICCFGLGMIVVAVNPNAYAINYQLLSWTFGMFISVPLVVVLVKWYLRISGNEIGVQEHQIFMFEAGCLHLWVLQVISMLMGIFGPWNIYPITWWNLFVLLRLISEALYVHFTAIRVVIGESKKNLIIDRSNVLTTSPEKIYKPYTALILTLAFSIFPFLITLDLVNVILSAFAPTVLESTSPTVVLAIIIISNMFYFVSIWHLFPDFMKNDKRIWKVRAYHVSFSLISSVFMFVAGLIILVVVCALPAYTKQNPLKVNYFNVMLAENQTITSNQISFWSFKHADWTLEHILKHEKYAESLHSCQNEFCNILLDSNFETNSDILKNFYVKRLENDEVEIHVPSETSFCYVYIDIDMASMKIGNNSSIPKKRFLSILKRHDQFRDAKTWKLLSFNENKLKKREIFIQCSFDDNLSQMVEIENLLPEWIVLDQYGSFSTEINYLIYL